MRLSHSMIALADFQTLSQRVTNQIKRTSAVIECEKQLAIGIRNAIEIEYEDRDSQRTMNHQRIQQKKDELNRLKAEYESLLQVLTSQESEIGMCWTGRNKENNGEIQDGKRNK